MWAFIFSSIRLLILPSSTSAFYAKYSISIVTIDADICLCKTFLKIKCNKTNSKIN